MKQVAKIIYMFTALMSFGTLQAANIELLEVVDTKTFHVSISEVKMWTEEVVWEVKVLNDMSIAFATPNEDEDSSVILTLDEPLEKDTEYSLLTVFGADGSIDFKTGDTLEGIEIMNPEVDEIGQSIESISLVDVNSIEVTYTEELEWGDFEFKLLSDIEVESLNPIDEDTISVTLWGALSTDKNYIFMVLALQDALSQDVELDEGIYNFVSPSEISDPVATQEWDDSLEVELDEDTEVSLDEEIEAEVDLNAAYNELESPAESVDLLDANIDRVVEDAVEAEEMQETAEEQTLETVALSATATPETGAETGVLILLTLFINTFYYFSRRKS